jgi:hypothetical protein
MADDWGDVYSFAPADDVGSRVTRLERGRQYFRAGQLVSPSGKLQSIPEGIIDSSNRIAIVSGVSLKGSVPPSGIVGNFGFTATATSITIYWDGTNGSNKLKIIRADGTAVQIPTNSMTVTGLSPSTTYGFLTFWSVFNNCGIGFVKGDSGTPQFAFTAAAQTVAAGTQQSLAGREALTGGFITFATPASGSSSGTGTGSRPGNPGMCVMLNTDIKPFSAGQEYITIHERQTDWINLAIENYPRTLNCTPNHPLYHADKGKMPADEFKVGDWMITEHGEKKLAEHRMFYKDCTKMQVKMPTGHLYFANGFLSHNTKLPQL